MKTSHFQTSPPVQGRIYISQNWICFHANILTWETTLQIPIAKVRLVRKASTIKVIPNAIVLEIDEDEGNETENTIRFTSFLDRNATFNVIYNLHEVYRDESQTLEQNSVLWGLVLKRYHSASDLTEMLHEQGWQKADLSRSKSTQALDQTAESQTTPGSACGSSTTTFGYVSLRQAGVMLFEFTVPERNKVDFFLKFFF